MASNVRSKGEAIRQFILENVEEHGSDIAAKTVEKFSISRQAVNKHLLKLRDQGALIKEGTSRSAVYKLAPLVTMSFSYPITKDLAEDIVWTKDIRPALEPLPENVMRIWHHGFTEMFNNAIDHSGGKEIRVFLRKFAMSTEVIIDDDGIGIFRKIQQELGLSDERHAIFELSKGKLTTDPRNHSGEGIFFTSRMFDNFCILSGGLYFDHDRTDGDDWLMERSKPADGTWVTMTLNNHTSRTAKKIFDEFTLGEDDDYSFSKTIVPVKLARFGPDELISRSQAKRMLARIELFKRVVFDFSGVESIGQAFADQIFRVFASEHPDIEMIPIHMSKNVKDMISRAEGAKAN